LIHQEPAKVFKATPLGLKPAIKKNAFTAAVNRCATQNRTFSAACETIPLTCEAMP